MKSTGGHTECLHLTLYAVLLCCTAVIALLCPPHLLSRCINWSCCEIWHRAPCCCGPVSYLCLVILLTMAPKHYYLDDEVAERGDGSFPEGKMCAGSEILSVTISKGFLMKAFGCQFSNFFRVITWKWQWVTDADPVGLRVLFHPLLSCGCYSGFFEATSDDISGFSSKSSVKNYCWVGH